MLHKLYEYVAVHKAGLVGLGLALGIIYMTAR